MYLQTGSTGFEVDGDRHALKSGHLTITRPWQLHRLENPNIGPSRLSWIILDVGVRRPDEEWKWPEWLKLSQRDLSELTGKLQLGENAVWTASAEIRVAFREISHCVSDWGDGGHLHFKNLRRAGQQRTCCLSGNVQTPTRCERIAGQPTDLDHKDRDGAGFNSSHYFATAFQRRFGMAPRAYRLITATASPR